MSRTQTRYDCDTGYVDGVVPLGATYFNVFTGTPVLTRTAPGNISYVQPAGETVQYVAQIDDIIYRTGVQDYLQERFGAGGKSFNPFGAVGQRVGTPTTTSTASAPATGNGVPATIAVQYSALFFVGNLVTIDVGALQEVQVITAIPSATSITVGQLQFSHTTPFTIVGGAWTTPAGVSGPPPFAGVSQFVAPLSRPKGIAIRGFEVRFQTLAAVLTTFTIGLLQTTYKNATALAITNILAPGANGLPVAVSATPQVVPVAIPNPAYLTADLTDYTLEIIATTGTGTFNFYGVTMYVTYNYN